MPLRHASAPPKKSPLQTMLCPTHHMPTVENADGLLTWVMKRRKARSGQPRSELPPLGPIADGCRGFDRDDQLADDVGEQEETEWRRLGNKNEKKKREGEEEEREANRDRRRHHCR